MKKRFFIIAFISALVINSGSFIFAQSGSSSAYEANRRTALRCLKQAGANVAVKNWNGALSQVSLGLAYDESISDLWYIKALAENQLGSSKAAIIPLLENALNRGNWVDYNRDGARLLYADILSDTLKCEQALEILDEAPLLFSADAEYVRTKCYYRLGGSENFSKARNKVDSARRIYPNDTRFPLLFFKYEDPLTNAPEVQRLSQFFIRQVAQYVEASPDKDAELEIYAASFAQGIDREHLLKSFNARSLKHPLYAKIALEEGLVTQQQAFEYLVPFAQDGINITLLEDLCALISDESSVTDIASYFNSFNGVLLFDTDGDGIDNLYAKYSRGRCETIGYDSTQDGVIDWTVVCDFGFPVAGTLHNLDIEFKWDYFPYLKKVCYKTNSGDSVYDFTLVSEQLKWSPLNVKVNEIISECIGSDFYIPEINKFESLFDIDQLILCASTFEVPSKERNNTRIVFTVLNGEIVLSDYYENTRLYAQTQFQDNIPVLRIVDTDGDGLFETTEFYALQTEVNGEPYSLEDEREIMTNLFGTPSNGAWFYLRMVQIDRDGDTIPDFTEEYFFNNGVSTSWDDNNDGLMDYRYARYPDEKDEDGNALPVVEEVFFKDKVSGNMHSIVSVDGEPSLLKAGEASQFKILKDTVYDFYWIVNEDFESIHNNASLEADLNLTAYNAIIEMQKNNIPFAESVIIQTKNLKAFVVNVFGRYYGKVVYNFDYAEETPVTEE